MTDDERREEHRQWLADEMRAKLAQWNIRSGPPLYRPALGMTLEIYKRREYTN